MYKNVLKVLIVMLLLIFEGKLILCTPCMAKTMHYEEVQNESKKYIVLKIGKDDQTKLNEYAKKYAIPKEIIEDVKESVKEIDKNKKITIKIPIGENMNKKSLPSVHGSYWSSTYTYKHNKKTYKMKDYYVEMPITKTQPTIVEKGSSTKSRMKAFKDASVYCAKKIVGKFGSSFLKGMNLLNYLYSNDTSFTSNRKDYVAVVVEYTYKKKYTYAWYDKQWTMGAFTCCGTIKSIAWESYIYSKNKTTRKTSKVNKTFYSPNYKNAKEKAVSNLLNPWCDEGLTYKIMNRTFYFN